MSIGAHKSLLNHDLWLHDIFYEIGSFLLTLNKELPSVNEPRNEINHLLHTQTGKLQSLKPNNEGLCFISLPSMIKLKRVQSARLHKSKVLVVDFVSICFLQLSLYFFHVMKLSS